MEANANPFAVVVLAHLKAMETRDRPELRRDWKIRLVKSLFERGLMAEDIRQLFRLIDWMLELPQELEDEFSADLQRFEEEQQMPYITSIERRALEKGEIIGLQQGIEIALELKFGNEGLTLLPLIQSVQQIDVLRSVQEAIRTAESLDEIRQLVK